MTPESGHGHAADSPAISQCDRTTHGDRSYPIRRAGTRRAARRAAPGAGRRRRAWPAGGAPLLHYVSIPRGGPEAVAAATRAISGRDDGDPAAPVLGPDGFGGSFRSRPVVRRHSRAAGGAVQFDQELLRPVGAIRLA